MMPVFNPKIVMLSYITPTKPTKIRTNKITLKAFCIAKSKLKSIFEKVLYRNQNNPSPIPACKGQGFPIRVDPVSPILLSILSIL